MRAETTTRLGDGGLRTYTVEARAAAKQGKSPGGRSPLTSEVLHALPWQAVLELDGLFRDLYQDPSASMPDMWRVLRLTMLPKFARTSEHRNFRGISLIDAMAKLYTASLTRLLRCELQACAPSDYWHPLVFGYEEGAAAAQMGVGLSALIQISCEWQHGPALYVLRVDVRVAFENMVPEGVLHALRSLGVPARTRRAFAQVLVGNPAVARLEVDTEEFPYLPTRQGGVESTVLWNVFLRRLLLDLEEVSACRRRCRSMWSRQGFVSGVGRQYLSCRRLHGGGEAHARCDGTGVVQAWH